MNLTELINEVYLLTNRPDLTSETRSAVKQATLKAHQSDYYPKDLYETAILWDPIGYTQSLEYRTLVSRWRAFKYLRKYDSTGTVAGDFFTLLPPELVVDSYNVAREDICYLAGEVLNIKSSTEDTYMLLGCYVHPDITDNGYDSWIALDHPYLIVNEATAKIFAIVGYEEQAARMQKEVAEQYAILRQEIFAGGY